jgi:hypothetical protein
MQTSFRAFDLLPFSCPKIFGQKKLINFQEGRPRRLSPEQIRPLPNEIQPEAGSLHPQDRDGPANQLESVRTAQKTNREFKSERREEE